MTDSFIINLGKWSQGMKRALSCIETGLLSALMCSLILLTGCGGTETSADLMQKDGIQGTAGQNGFEMEQTINAQTEKEKVETINSQAEKEKVETEGWSGDNSTGETGTKQDYVLEVQITINPKIALFLAADGSIVDVEYLNEDARNAFSVLDITGASFEDAMSMIVDTAVKEGYLKENKTISVDFIQTGSDEVTIEKLTQKVETAVQDILTEEQILATLEIEVMGKVQERVTLEPEVSEVAKEPCPDCGGTGICPECGGGTLPCKRCGGSLWEKCGVCGGSGHQTCQGCHGSGKDATDGNNCRHCGGSGGYICELCGRTGGKSCSICNGKGVVSDDCILCHGGRSCITCGGTGTK